MKRFQSTLKKAITLSGYGVHGGKPATAVLRPAPPDYGIVFLRRDRAGRLYRFPADADHAVPTDLCTALGKADVRIETIEHLMAVLAASGLDNLEIEVSGQEVPILDGSCAVYMKAIADAGIEMQAAARQYIRILEPVDVRSASGSAGFAPSDSMRFDISIAFATPVIGEQQIAFALDADYFTREIAPARTFGFLEDAQALWAAGLALGSSLENSVVVGPRGEVLNKGGLVAADEFVRHKALDAIGDTALLGRPFIGVFHSFKGGHRLNAQAVRAVLDNPHNYEIMELAS